jgi:hypothetical protein
MAQGFLLKCRDSSLADGFAHTFCGQHRLRGADCPNCRKALLSFVSLDTRDPRLRLEALAPHPLPLLFCWTCNIAQAAFVYALDRRAGIELVEWGRGGRTSLFPYPDYPQFFPPALVLLRPLSRRLQELIRRLNADPHLSHYPKRIRRIATPAHQLGGEPYLEQGLVPMPCPACAVTMSFLASIGDRCLDPRGFTGNPHVQVIYNYCGGCRLVRCYQQTD